MEDADIASFRIGEEIGHGGCGQVFRALTPEGRDVAVKILDGLSIARGVLAQSMRRLAIGGWPEGVVPISAANLSKAHRFVVMPLLLEENESGGLRGRSLQHQLHSLNRSQAWRIIRDLADALSRMHERRVTHGNLKPGNVMFGADGELLLSDYGLGLMPGVQVFHFTDALLYMSPEQLLDPDGYEDEQGYRWDVFAFGVMAFRLLTGKFPRCEDSFSAVAPKPGQTGNDRLQADMVKIAGNLVESPRMPWPDEAESENEAGWREWIDRCLELAPHERPTTMVEVANGLAAVESNNAERAARVRVEGKRRVAVKLMLLTLFGFLASTLAAIVLAGLWMVTGSQLGSVRHKLATITEEKDKVIFKAYQNRDLARKDAAEARKTLAYEKERWLARLDASREVGDELFAWALEKGHRRLPPLDGRETRLKRLETYFTNFLTRTAEIDALRDAHARAKLQLSEISIALGDAPAAEQRLQEALSAMADTPMNAGTRLRIARDTLLLALLRQAGSDAETEKAFVAARTALDAVSRAEVDSTRLDQMYAVLDFNEAKVLAGKGEDAKALGQLMRATETLNRLTNEMPDMAVLHSELAECYLASATILDGMGNLGDAREVRALAANELVGMLKQRPGDAKLRMELAACYGAISEANALSGDISGAESYGAESLKVLDGILLKEPENTEALVRKAAQIGVLAGIERDKGHADKAKQQYDEAIRTLETKAASDAKNAMVLYRLALLTWERGRMDGSDGKQSEETTALRKAKDLLETVETLKDANGPRPEQLTRAQAYLMGDLGLSLKLQNHMPECREVFGQAVKLWESLSSDRPDTEEYDDALAWCRKMLQESQ